MRKGVPTPSLLHWVSHASRGRRERIDKINDKRMDDDEQDSTGGSTWITKVDETYSTISAIGDERKGRRIKLFFFRRKFVSAMCYIMTMVVYIGAFLNFSLLFV